MSLIDYSRRLDGRGFWTEFSGDGTISGTVKKYASPVNLPVAVVVVLLRQPDHRHVATTWSDADTGAYSFAAINRDYLYDVLTIDPAGGYRSYIATNLRPVVA